MRKGVLLFLLLFLVFYTASAQTGDNSSETWYLNKPVENITFKGLVNVSETELDGVIEPYIGEKFTNPLSWDLQSSLYALDYFEELLPEALPGTAGRSSVIIQFTVKERPVVNTIVIDGNNSVRENDILDAVLLKTGDMVNKAKLSVDVEAIRALYLEKGYPDVDVKGRIERDEETSATVVFTITEGSQTRVAEIRFSGISFASESTLKRTMKTKERSLFSSGVYQESKVAEDRRAVELYYWDRGYVDAKVMDVVKTVEESEEEGSQLTLTFYIEEGKQWTYGGMTFEGNDLFSDGELEELLRQTPGKVLSRTKLETDFQRINDLYASDGYIYNTISLDAIRDEEKREIRYVIRIVERGRAHIANIIIRGNEKTKDYVIYRELPFEVGDIFSARNYIQGWQNLQNTQYFSSIIPDVRQSTEEGLVDVIFNVEEGRTTNIEFGITFSGASSGIPLVGIVGWNDSNFLGKGQNFRIGTEVAGNTQNLNFSFTENWLFQKRWSAGADLTIDHSLAQNIKQDILAPVFSASDPNRVPDPYDGHYVNKADGTPFTGTWEELTDAVANGDVVTDYAYAVSNGETIDSSYLMEYDSFNITLGGSTGYTFVTPYGRIGLATRLDTALSFVNYDEAVYRPYDAAIRENLGSLKPNTKQIFNVTFDSRDLVISPTKGIFARQSFTYNGGILPSTRDYILSSSKLQGFLKLFDVPLTETGNLTGVLALNSSIAFILPQWAKGENGWEWMTNITSQELLYVDGLTMARGWSPLYDRKVLWDNWIELRMPIIKDYIWWDWYFSGTGSWPETAQFKNLTVNDFLFGFGGGARLTIPGFPIGLYFTKRFTFENDQIAWQGGNVFSRVNKPDSGIDFVISFTADLY
ncbi:MAG: outer membrane protein assembly factor BamA [Spirochaetales bacterium]|nr:outer membrane protein assembly factor BamA [Spirochaetales bacterium]